MTSIKEGTTEMVLQFTMQLNPYTRKTLVSLKKNVFLNTTEIFKQENIYRLTLFLSQKILMTFSRAALYRLMLVLHKDAIFH